MGDGPHGRGRLDDRRRIASSRSAARSCTARMRVSESLRLVACPHHVTRQAERRARRRPRRRSNRKAARKRRNASSSATCRRPADAARAIGCRAARRDYLRMNSNSYLSLSFHPALLEAADDATHAFGVGPGAVRFIDGTFAPHVELESAHRPVRRPAGGARVQLRLHHGARPRHHAVGPGHVLDRRRAQSQLHHPRDAHRQRAVRAAGHLQAQRRGRSRSPSRAGARTAPGGCW